MNPWRYIMLWEPQVWDVYGPQDKRVELEDRYGFKATAVLGWDVELEMAHFSILTYDLIGPIWKWRFLE